MVKLGTYLLATHAPVQMEPSIVVPKRVLKWIVKTFTFQPENVVQFALWFVDSMEPNTKTETHGNQHLVKVVVVKMEPLIVFKNNVIQHLAPIPMFLKDSVVRFAL